MNAENEFHLVGRPKIMIISTVCRNFYVFGCIKINDKKRYRTGPGRHLNFLVLLKTKRKRDTNLQPFHVVLSKFVHVYAFSIASPES